MDMNMPEATKQENIEVFLSYAREDEKFCKKLETHFSLLMRQGIIKTWRDRNIDAGSEWKREIDTHLDMAQIILLLVSPDFIASDYCYSVEMTRAMERHKSGEAHVIPIILRPVDWQSAPFGKLQALPRDAEPIVKWYDQDDAFYNITEEIRDIVEGRKAKENRLRKTKEPWLKEGDKHESEEAQQVLLAREELLRPIESSQAANSSQRSPRLPRLHLPIFVVFILLVLIVGSLIYRVALGYFPWQASPRLSTSILSAHTAQPSVSALGRSWHSGNLDNSGDLSGVAWSGSRFVAVGGSCRLFFLFCSGVIFTSPDGITWTSQNSTTSQHLSSVAWSGSRFVIVGGSGTVLASSDGIVWTPQDSGITGDLSDVAWLDSRFVAVGGSCRLFSFFCSDTIFTSPDGITWTSQHTPTNQHLHKVAWSGSRFVAVGNSGTIFTSPDGITWTSQSSGTAVDLLSVVWSGFRFVIVGDNGTILTSSDGIAWTPQHPLTAKNLDDIVWSGSRFVVVGSSGIIITSPDGIAWTSQDSGTSQDIDDIVWSGSRFVTVGISGVISTSP